MSGRALPWLPAAVAGLAAFAACNPQDIDPLEQQPKFKAYSENELYPDGRAMRTPPEETVPRERELSQAAREQPVVTAELLALGHESFDGTCAVCHGLIGDGDSIVGGKMGLRAPPSLHDQRVRDMPATQLYTVISEGYGVMPRYAAVLSPRERWAVIAYVRALQLSQRFPVAEAPEDVRRKLRAVR